MRLPEKKPHYGGYGRVIALIDCVFNIPSKVRYKIIGKVQTSYHLKGTCSKYKQNRIIIYQAERIERKPK